MTRSGRRSVKRGRGKAFLKATTQIPDHLSEQSFCVSRHRGFALAAISALSRVERPRVSLAKIAKWTSDYESSGAVPRLRKLMNDALDTLVDAPVVAAQKGSCTLTKYGATIAKSARTADRPKASRNGIDKS
jgi:hypothetical protein